MDGISVISDMKIYKVQKIGYLPSLHTKMRSPSLFSSWSELPFVCKNKQYPPIGDNHTQSVLVSDDLDSVLYTKVNGLDKY